MQMDWAICVKNIVQYLKTFLWYMTCRHATKYEYYTVYYIIIKIQTEGLPGRPLVCVSDMGSHRMQHQSHVNV